MCQILHNLEFLKEPLAFSTVLRAHVKKPFTALEELPLLDHIFTWIKNRLYKNLVFFSRSCTPRGASLSICLLLSLTVLDLRRSAFHWPTFMPSFYPVDWIIYYVHQDSQVLEMWVHVSLCISHQTFVTCSHRLVSVCTRDWGNLSPK